MGAVKKSVVGLLSVLILMGPIGSAWAEHPTTAYGPKNKRFGAGIILGDPSGLSFKGYVTQRFAIDAIFAWSFVHDTITVGGDLLYDIMDIPVNVRAFTLPWYIGAGALVGFGTRGKNDGKTFATIRVPLGLSMQFTEYPIEVFFEIAPGLQIAPSTDVDVSGGIGVRFYFL